MARKRKTIYESNEKRLVQKNSCEKNIFNYLLKNKDVGVTQKQIYSDLKISQGTVSTILKELVGKPYVYRKKEYMVYKENNLYVMKDSKSNIKKNNIVSCTDTVSNMSNIDEDTVKFNSPKIWLKEYARQITNTVIFYDIHPYFRSKIITYLRQSYGKKIHDLIPCKNGIYIILRESNTTKETAKKILEFYSECYKNSHIK